MKLRVEFSELENLVRRMGARPMEVEVELEKIVSVLVGWRRRPEGPAGSYRLLTYGGDFVAIYIKNWRRDDLATMLASERNDSDENRPKYHVCECATIEEMRKERRFFRYVASRRTSGRFPVVPNDQKRDVDIRLQVCKNCLAALDWQSYRRRGKTDRNRIRDRFVLAEFRVKCEADFLWWPKYTDEMTLPSGYVKNWPEISRKYRERAGWRCKECGVWLFSHRYLLHCHHKNGDLENNSPANIAVLCVECHSMQPRHDMNVPDETAQVLDRLRKEQGLGAVAYKSTRRRAFRPVRGGEPRRSPKGGGGRGGGRSEGLLGGLGSGGR